MKRNLRYISCILVIAIIFTCSAGASNIGDTKSDLTEIEQLGQAQKGALDAFFKIKNVIAYDETANKYPDAFGGTYISNDNELVIQIKDGDKQFKELLSCYLTDDMPVVYSNCLYSLNDLYRISKEFLDTLDFKSSAYVSFDEKENQVIINLQEIPTETETVIIEEVRRAQLPICINTSSINSTITDNTVHEVISDTINNTELATVLPSIQLVGGSTLYKKNGSIYQECGTLGFGGTYNGKVAYLTAGHVLPGHYVRTADTINNQITYTYEEQVIDHNGDFAIVTMTSNNYTIGASNTVKTGANSTGVVQYYYCISNELPSGTYIFKYGKTTGMTFGVYNRAQGSYTWRIDEDGDGTAETTYNIGGLYSFSPVDGSLGVNPMINNFGDSGGPVWFVYGNYRVLLGCISGFEYDIEYEGNVPYIASITRVYYQPIEKVLTYNFTLPETVTHLNPDSMDDSLISGQ